MHHRSPTRVWRLTSLPLAVLVMFAIGCGAKNSIVGKWHTTIGSSPSAMATMDIEYGPDGATATDIKTLQQETKIQGTYTLSGDVVNETVTAIAINGQNVPIPATAKNSDSKHFKVEGETLTYSDPSRPGHLTLTRVH